ncbi:MAG: hypothetical protein V4608_14835 [Bacteroidota bacterium]
MKKSLTILAFALIGFTANAQSVKPDTLLHRVNWIDQIGTKAELSKESKLRKAKVLEMVKSGYTFVGNERRTTGLYMKFVK